MAKTKYFLLLFVVYLAGCAHPIVISPRTDKLPPTNSNVVQKNVGYYISPTERALEVTTEGGGGDKIKYKPYADLEAGIYKVLLNLYKNVVKLTSTDKSEISKHNISYVFTPKIVTKSSSTGFFTWPPTDFEIDLTMQARDGNGGVLWNNVVTAKGHAEFDEFKHDFQLSARRASEALLIELQKEIAGTASLN